MEHTEESRAYRAFRAIFWQVAPAALVFGGLLAHRGWIALVGLLMFGGLALEIGTWSGRTRKMVGTPVAVVVGISSLVYGIEAMNWWRIAMGVGMCFVAAVNGAALWQERTRR